MPGTADALLAIYVDGETKTGKGAAGAAIAEVLQNSGVNIYYDVAGDFYRRYTAWVRLALGLSDDDDLPVGAALEKTVTEVYRSGQAYKLDNGRLDDLQRPAISESVSKLGELPIAQRAGAEWWVATLKQADEAKAAVLIIDGRNPRLKVVEALRRQPVPLIIALDLFMTCSPAVAGQRLLISRGVRTPSGQQLNAAEAEVIERRGQDRRRPVNPFIIPSDTLPFDPGQLPAEVVRQSWQGTEPPSPISLDNSDLDMADMLTAVSELAVQALAYAGRK